MQHLFRAVAVLFLLAGVGARAQSGGVPLTAEDRRATVERAAELLAERYVFEDVGRAAGTHVRQRLAAGAYDDLADAGAFADRLTADLQSVTHDRHMRVRPRRPPPEGAQADPDLAFAEGMREMRAQNYGFERVERLDGNVGYLKFDYFGPPERVRETAAAAMHMLAGADAIIFDLRENGGGSPATVQFICSYLFGERTHLNTLYWREGDRTEEFWTLDDVPGERMPDVPVFVLTSNRTFSGAEEFAYNLRTRDRATLVGETTGGGANPGGGFPLGPGLTIFVPEGRAVNQVTGTNWEGTGVEPHVATQAAEALEVALPLAREAATRHREASIAAAGAAAREMRSQLERAEAAAGAGRPDAAADLTSRALRAAVDAGVVGEDAINAMGYRYLGAGAHAMAIAVLRFNVAEYPESFNTYDSLGEAYMEAGQRDLAIANYERSLGLNPGNENGRRMLERLRAGADAAVGTGQ